MFASISTSKLNRITLAASTFLLFASALWVLDISTDIVLSYKDISKNGTKVIKLANESTAVKTTISNNKNIIEIRSDEPVWVKLSAEESKPYMETECTHKFQHCCVGQCRQAGVRLKPEDALWKWNDKREGADELSTFDDLLDYVDNLRPSNSNSCNILYFGDSLSADTAMASACKLMSIGYKLTSCEPKIGDRSYGSDVDVVCGANLYPSIPHFTLESEKKRTCQKVNIIFLVGTARQKLIDKVSTILTLFGQGIGIFGWGHCNEPNCLLEYYKRYLLPIFKDEEKEFEKWKFVFRETQPQHFNNAEGLLVTPHSSLHQCNPTNGTAGKWRNEVLELFLSDHGLTEKVPIVRIFDKFEPLWPLLNSETGECTHSCYNPFRFDVIWDAILTALKNKAAISNRSISKGESKVMKVANESTATKTIRSKGESKVMKLANESTATKTIRSNDFNEIEMHSDEPMWVKPSSKESKPYLEEQCTHKFEHCCVGQCRQAAVRLEPKSALWKWNNRREGAGELSSFDDLLDYLDNLRPSNSTECNILYFGDSLSSDNAMASVCQLMRIDYRLTSCWPNIAGKVYGNDVHVICDANLYPSIPHFILESDMKRSCQKINILFFDGSRTEKLEDKVSSLLTLFGHGIGVFNWGVHCNEPKCLREYYERYLLPIFKDKKKEFEDWKFLFRETPPQHFNNKGGLYAQGRGNECRPTNGMADKWRNEILELFLSKHGLTEKVPIIRIFDKFEPLWQIHNKKNGDCTHYCYNPFRFDVIWDAMLTALK